MKWPKFEDGSNSLGYKQWLRKLKNLLKIIECPERFNVHLATYQFEREAKFWWGTVKA